MTAAHEPEHETLTRYSEAAAQMRDPDRYAALRALTFEQRHPCPVDECQLSAEEHHRLAFGYLSENAALRRRVAELEHGLPTGGTGGAEVCEHGFRPEPGRCPAGCTVATHTRYGERSS